MKPPNERSRPVKAAPRKSTAIEVSSDSSLFAEDRPSTGRRYWARQLIDRAPKPIPAYGSTEWLGLALDDPAKVAACVLAAECWATAGDDLEVDLEREAAAMARAFKSGEDAAYLERAQAHRDQFRRTPRGSSFTKRRAAQLAAIEPRPGDHPGGPASWNGGDAS